MARASRFSQCALLVLAYILLQVNHSEQLQSSQAQTLLRIQGLLNNPTVLSSWNITTEFCNTEPTSSLTVVCYEESITQLHIVGNKRAPTLPLSFSMDSFVTTLVKLPDLKVLRLVSLGLWGPLSGKISRLSSLEILNMSSNFLNGSVPQELSILTSLQTLILDENMLAGRVPDWLGSLPILAVLSLRNNMFNGTLPDSFSYLENLRVLALSNNHFYGEVPDFSGLTYLQVLDLENNALGPQFPKVGKKLVTMILSKNKFRSAIPAEVSSYYQLQRLDLSSNRFVGPFPQALLSLPSITYLNIADNKLTGKLFDDLSCNPELGFVDLSSNLLTGQLPDCLLAGSKNRVVLYARNCLAAGNENQHPLSFCQNEALAVGILPLQKKQKQVSKAVLALSIIGGIIGGISLFVIAFLLVRRTKSKQTMKKTPTRVIQENASTGYTSKFLSDARYISQTMKLGALGLPAYRTFSLEELEEATNNFDTSAFMGEGSKGQMYRGRLKNGTFIAISRIFLIFEYVPNGTLRSWISVNQIMPLCSGWFQSLRYFYAEGHAWQSLTWTQRISAAIGVARGIQFLHTGIVPGVFSNNLKITDILLDQNLVAKISSYNLPLLAENAEKVGHVTPYSGSINPTNSARGKLEDKIDIYDFGLILLEIIVGRPLKSRKEVDLLKNQLQAVITADESARRSMVDPAVNKACLDESLKTMMEVCVRCLLKNPAERPSVEDVLWNLQFAAQVQDAWHSQSSEGSPISPPWPSHQHLSFH
ncbi:putative inactive leucine-rich repeat receptor-like protein kinase [Citrus sinensis]|uniref:Inactive leucine-rich repeat receptor-like protein kinase n=1 Tax=Citrus sinensis TaxID=2711 RepID=A0ACB8MG82_CITSI|nr:putative inactive leucine-rich repeat receptor-like protein kinase [Citrus sinensis]